MAFINSRGYFKPPKGLIYGNLLEFAYYAMVHFKDIKYFIN